MEAYTASGIVLNTIKYSDTSVIAYLLTDRFGRRSYMVQGIRKSARGNRSAVLQPMFPVEIEAVTSPRIQIDRIRDIRLSHPLSSMPFDIRKSTVSIYMAELLYRAVRESEPDNALFSFVRSSVDAFDRMSDGVPNFHLWFTVRLCTLLGFRPANRYSPGSVFDIAEGRFTTGIPTQGTYLDTDQSAVLEAMLDTGAQDLGRIKLSGAARSGFLSGMIRYLTYHLESLGEIRSLEYFSEIF